jgi:hypothetical protein
MADSGVTTRPIESEDAPAIAAFLHRELNAAVSAEAWLALLRPPWGDLGPNHGFQLVTDDGTIAGVYVAVYSRREIDGAVAELCNLAAFCVLEAYRPHSFRLIRALLAQPGFVFTDLSPSGNVIAMNERLRFTRLDSSTRLVINLPRPRGRGLTITADPDDLARVLTGYDARAYQDHRNAPAVEHLLVQRGDRYGYLMFRRHRRKGLRLFAGPLFVGGDRSVIEKAWPSIRSHWLRRGVPFTLAERRVLGFDHGLGLGTELAHPRVKMFRGSGIRADQIDDLYSELTLVAW